MSKPIYILGGYQTDFAENALRAGKDINQLVQDCANGLFAAVNIEPSAIDVAHIGNFVGDRFTGQAHLGGVLAEAHPGLRNIAISRHEAACASGSMAILAAMADLESGRYQQAVVLGVEMMRNVSGSEAAGHLAPAAWVGKESHDAKFMWPAQFSAITEEYQRRYGVQQIHLGAIARNNLDNAKRNPNAQTRGWQYEPINFTSDDEANPIVEGHVRRYDCSQVTDGACAVVLANAERAAEYAAANKIALEQIPRIKGWGHRTARISLYDKFADAKDSALLFPHLAQTINDARQRAGIDNAWQLDGIETHDCFSISEYVALDHLGLSKPGEAWKLVENGDITFSGKLPVNASGGLIGQGHPVGATGVRMLLDGYKQVSNQAGDYQIEGAKNLQTLNIGGSTTTVASFVVGI